MSEIRVSEPPGALEMNATNNADAALAPFSRWVIAVGGLLFAVLMALSGRYGFHHDELYFLDCGRHLQASYVDQPVFTPLLAWVTLKTFGVSLIGLRLWPALAAWGTVIVAGLTAREFGGTIVWRVVLEDGSQLDGTVSSAACAEVWRGEVAGSWITRRRFELAVDLPPGYHQLEAKIAGGSPDHCLLIVSPPKCFEPAAIAAGKRLWGISVQLYTVRSHVNWGIGDFRDLEMLIRWMAGCGAGFIGVNPLHALAPADPQRASPYSASSRHFLNVLYISVPAVPEFADSLAARARMADPEFAHRLHGLRERPLVDYRGVANLKFEILALLYQEFRDNHLAKRSDRGRAFLNFVARRGLPLQYAWAPTAVLIGWSALFALIAVWRFNWEDG